LLADTQQIFCAVHQKRKISERKMKCANNCFSQSNKVLLLLNSETGAETNRNGFFSQFLMEINLMNALRGLEKSI
jgi:hypothetical protein